MKRFHIGGKLLVFGAFRQTAIVMQTSELGWWLKQLRTEMAINFSDLFLYPSTFGYRSISTIHRNSPSETSHSGEHRLIVPDVLQAALSQLELWHCWLGCDQMPVIASQWSWLSLQLPSKKWFMWVLPSLFGQNNPDPLLSPLRVLLEAECKAQRGPTHQEKLDGQ